MSQAPAITSVFDAQRSAIEQGREALRRTVDLQKQSTAAFVRSIDTQQAVAREGSQFAEQAVDAYLDAVESSLPEGSADFDELRAAVHENFQRFDETQGDAWESTRRAMEEAVEAGDAFADAYVDAADSAFDAYLDAHERVEASVTEAAEAVEIPVDEE